MIAADTTTADGAHIFLHKHRQSHEGREGREKGSDDGTPEFSGVGVWTPFRVPKQELESQESIPLRN